MRSRPRVRAVTEAERAWKTPRYGRCENCGLLDDSRPLHGHHVIARPVLRRVALDLEWDPRVRMDLCPTCHMNHEFGQANRKIAVEKIPERCLAFSVDLLGEERAAIYIHRHYLIAACGVSGTAPFVKQLGGARPGTKLEDLPEDLRIREHPAVSA